MSFVASRPKRQRVDPSSPEMCCPNAKDTGRVPLMSFGATKMPGISWLADSAAAGTAALRHLGNTPQGYGGQGWVNGRVGVSECRRWGYFNCGIPNAERG